MTDYVKMTVDKLQQITVRCATLHENRSVLAPTDRPICPLRENLANACSYFDQVIKDAYPPDIFFDEINCNANVGLSTTALFIAALRRLPSRQNNVPIISYSVFGNMNPHYTSRIMIRIPLYETACHPGPSEQLNLFGEEIHVSTFEEDISSMLAYHINNGLCENRLTNILSPDRTYYRSLYKIFSEMEFGVSTNPQRTATILNALDEFGGSETQISRGFWSFLSTLQPTLYFGLKGIYRPKPIDLQL